MNLGNAAKAVMRPGRAGNRYVKPDLAACKKLSQVRRVFNWPGKGRVLLVPLIKGGAAFLQSIQA